MGNPLPDDCNPLPDDCNPLPDDCNPLPDLAACAPPKGTYPSNPPTDNGTDIWTVDFSAQDSHSVVPSTAISARKFQTKLDMDLQNRLSDTRVQDLFVSDFSSLSPRSPCDLPAPSSASNFGSSQSCSRVGQQAVHHSTGPHRRSEASPEPIPTAAPKTRPVAAGD